MKCRLLTFAFICAAASGQAQGLRPDAALSAWQRNHLQEVVHLQTATESALAGELLWFGVRTAEGLSAKPLDFSRTAYVELVHPSGSVAIRAAVPLTGGAGSGSFLLTPELSSGRYTLRAFTAWQRNFDTARFFTKELLLINPLRSEGVLQTAGPKLSLRLTAEGGSLVAGIPGRLEAELEGVRSFSGWQGALVRGVRDTVQRFSFDGEGRASFSLTPEEGSVYRAIAFEAEGALVQGDAPSVQPSGYALRVDPSASGFRVKVASRNAGSRAFLMGHHRGRLLFYQPLSFTGGVAQLDINAAQTGPGLTVFTVFTENGQPAAERLVFQPYAVGPAAPALASAAGKRAPMEFRLPEDGRLLTATVRRKSALEEGSNTLASYLLLQSLLNRPVPGADAYLDGQKPEVLDALLRARSWAGFSWADVLTDTALRVVHLPEVERWQVRLDAAATAEGGGRSVNNELLSAPLAGPQVEDAAARSLGMQVQQAFYGARLDSLAVSVQDSLPFYGAPSKAYLLEDYTRFPTMEEVFREFILEVIVRREGGGNARVRMLSTKEQMYFDKAPLILLDNRPLNEADVLKVDPLKIRRIDVLPYHYITGQIQHSGVLSLHSYDGRLQRPPGSDSLARPVSAASTISFRPFFSPDHSVPDPRPDFRHLLFWQPPTPVQAPLRFYTSDIEGAYDVVIEGWTGKGVPFSTRSAFRVN